MTPLAHQPPAVAAYLTRYRVKATVADLAGQGYTPGDPALALAAELAVDRLCATEWPCPGCRHTGRALVTFVALDGSHRWRSVAFCPTCGTGEHL